MLTLLALDTSTEACSVSVIRGDQQNSLFEPTPRQHSQKILPMIEQVLTDAGCAKSEIDAIAFGRGPGSFTGVRIGVSVAQGLAYGLNLPLIPVSDTLAMAEQHFYQNPMSNFVLVAIDARMNEVYFAAYHRRATDIVELVEEQVVAPSEIDLTMLVDHQWQAVGTGWKVDGFSTELLGLIENVDATCLPHAESVARLGLPLYKSKEFKSIEDCLPSYLRNDVAWKKITDQ